METPDTVVWVVADDEEIQERGYLDKAAADRRAEHLRKNDGKVAFSFPVKVWIPPTAPEYIPMPYPVMPNVPSMIYTPDTGPPMTVAYDAPRRVFRQPEPSLGDVISSTWAAWASAQAAKGNFEEAAAARPAIEQLFEESPEGRLQLFPRDLPAPVH